MLDSIIVPSVSIPGLEARIAVALAFCAAAAYYDFRNNKWVPNWLVYGSVAASVLANIIFFDPSIFVQAMAFGIVVFVFTYPLYKLGQIGGADSYLMASIAILLPYLPRSLLGWENTTPYPFLLSVLVPTGVLFILHMLARFLPYISRQLSQGKVHFARNDLLGAAVLLSFVCIFIYVASSMPIFLPPFYFAAVSFLTLAMVFFSVFKTQIKDSMAQEVKVGKLQEEDVLALEKMDRSLIKKLKLSAVLDARSISALKTAKVNSVPVYTGMPFFLPYLFLGLLISVLFGDLLSYLISV